MRYSGSDDAVAGTGSADHLKAFATINTACGLVGQLRDSLCVATGARGTAIDLQTTTSADASLTGVTAVARAPGGIALMQSATGSTAFTVTAVDDVFQGAGFDIFQSAGVGTAETIDTSHCDYSTTGHTGAATGVHSDGGNTSTAPAFLDAAHGDYREAAGSVTVDAGDPSAVTRGETDLAGLPRQVGSAPDMGAYEFARKPTIRSFRIVGRARHALRVAVLIDPGGLATRLTAVATHASRSVRRTVGIGPAMAVRSVRITVPRLSRHTGYRVRILAANAAGQVRSRQRGARTT